MKLNRASLPIVGIAMSAAVAIAGGDAVLESTAPAGIHDAFESLLERYVVGDRVDYTRWAASSEDRATLGAYVASLEKRSPGAMGKADALAYWINLYNAVTLEVILDAYPIDSIRAIFPDEPDRVWKEPRVDVDGRSLSLDDIENDVIRPTFRDPRIHFAVSCASLGCPPLRSRAFTGEGLDEQLDTVTRQALNDPRWVRISASEIALSKIFEWFEADFAAAAGSVAAFVARYRGDAGDSGARNRLVERLGDARFDEYDWRLNAVR